MRRLPPLTAIEAFVQVAREGSVKAAAEALALSSPALTRRVQSLERYLGRPLFDRHHQGVSLNPDGERLLAEIGPSLDSLALAMERATGEATLLRLRLSVLPLFASQRLMPHLPELRMRHPELHIDMDTGPHGLARLDDGLDAVICLSPEVDPSLYSRRIDTNRILAIGAREIAEGSNALVHPRQLESVTIYIHREMPDTFDYWRDAIGMPDLQPAAIDLFDSGQLILEAAAQGLGVAFMHESHLIDAHDERLVQLFGRTVESPYSYWFVCRRSALTRRPVRIFHDWLFDRIGSQEAAKASALPQSAASPRAA